MTKVCHSQQLLTLPEKLAERKDYFQKIVKNRFFSEKGLPTIAYASPYQGRRESIRYDVGKRCCEVVANG